MDENKKQEELNAIAENVLLKEELAEIKKREKYRLAKIKESNDAVERLVNYSDGFYKHIITVMVTLLGLLIGLAPIKNLDLQGKTYFLYSVLLISLCVVFAVMTLYSNVFLLKKTHRILLNHVEKSKYNEKKEDKAKEPSPFVLAEYATLATLFLSFLLLFLYVKKLLEISFYI